MSCHHPHQHHFVASTPSQPVQLPTKTTMTRAPQSYFIIFFFYTTTGCLKTHLGFNFHLFIYSTNKLVRLRVRNGNGNHNNRKTSTAAQSGGSRCVCISSPGLLFWASITLLTAILGLVYSRHHHSTQILQRQTGFLRWTRWMLFWMFCMHRTHIYLGLAVERYVLITFSSNNAHTSSFAATKPCLLCFDSVMTRVLAATTTAWQPPSSMSFLVCF
jgi:hypothetical protein